MNKKLAKLGAATLLVAGAGSMLMKKSGMKSGNPETKAQREKELKEFRNTERGRPKTARAFTIPTATTRHSRVRRSRRV